MSKPRPLDRESILAVIDKLQEEGTLDVGLDRVYDAGKRAGQRDSYERLKAKRDFLDCLAGKVGKDPLRPAEYVSPPQVPSSQPPSSQYPYPIQPEPQRLTAKRRDVLEFAAQFPDGFTAEEYKRLNGKGNVILYKMAGLGLLVKAGPRFYLPQLASGQKPKAGNENNE